VTDPRTARRRDLLRSVGPGLLAVIGGCGSRSPAPRRDDTTATTGATTHTETTADLDLRPANTGDYTDWMVATDEATMYNYQYLPEYAWYFEHVPLATSKGALGQLLSDPSMGVLDASEIQELFYGGTGPTGFRFQIAWGTFRRRALHETLVAEHAFESLERSVAGFDLLERSGALVGVRDGLWVDATVPPGRNRHRYFELVADGVRGEASSYVETDEDYALLAEHLRRGQYITGNPNVAAELDVPAYGRQYVWAGERGARPEEVVVFETEPDAATARAAVDGSTFFTAAERADIESVAVDGRVATVTYEILPHCEYMHDFQSPTCWS
jgi:hypothetical protein